MHINKALMLVAVLASPAIAFAQHTNTEKDSIYIHQVEDHQEPDKVLHAEPLYIDLIRDLGARKGEREWNLGLGLTDNLAFDAYEALIEYEWAPVNRLGLEVELPFTFFSPVSGNRRDSVPPSRLNSLKVAAQWSFLVSEPMATTMALGYIHEFELSDFSRFGNPFLKGMVYNPFLVVARRWGSNIHSLVYTGPMIEQDLRTDQVHAAYDLNASFHYMISGTRNFVGTEFNMTFDRRDYDLTIRPQMRLGIAHNVMVGIVAGIPVSRENQRLSSFLRLIWEPGHARK